MTNELQIDFDRTVLGQEVDGGTIEVTREQILAFVSAIGETNPVYTDDAEAHKAGYDSIIAPPAFVNTVRGRGQRPDPKIQHGTLTFFANQAVEFHEPVKPGDTIRSVTSLEDVYAKTGRAGVMVFEVWKTTMTNQDGNLVAISRESMVHR